MLEENDIDISCSRKKYLELIKYVPKSIIYENDFFIYETIVDKEEDRFGIYK